MLTNAQRDAVIEIITREYVNSFINDVMESVAEIVANYVEDIDGITGDLLAETFSDELDNRLIYTSDIIQVWEQSWVGEPTEMLDTISNSMSMAIIESAHELAPDFDSMADEIHSLEV